jgi:AhpD family alkylhydroperoxidase
MKNPAMILPEVTQAVYALVGALKKTGAPARILALTHLRASQVNGCSVCVDMGWKELKHLGESEKRIMAVSAWHDAPYFTDAERAALALTEAATRLSDRSDAVPDDIWEEAARHYDEKTLAAIVVNVALTNFFNRVNVTTRQVAGQWEGSGKVEETEETTVASR